MKRILVFAGSSREGSLNRRLAQACAERLRSICDVDNLDATEIDLPLFDQDLENDPEILARMLRTYMRFAASDGMVLCSPEYNHSISPLLKNTLDWVSRPPYIDSGVRSAFTGKPVLLASAGSGWSGGAFAVLHLRSVMAYLGALVMAEQIVLPHAESMLEAEQPHFPADCDAFLCDALRRLTDLAERFLESEAPA